MNARSGSIFLGACVLAGLTLTSACSTIVGIGDLPGLTDGGGSDAALPRPDGGNAGDGGNAAPDGSSGDGAVINAAAAFIGTWATTGGTQTLSNCTFASNDGTSDVPLTIELVFTAGTTSDLVATYSGARSSGCTFLANISGTTATAAPGQTCIEPGASENDQLDLTAYSFSLMGNTMAAELAGATLTDISATAPQPTCDLTESVTYVRE